MPGFITHLMLREEIASNYHNSKWTFLVNKHPAVYNLGLEGPDIFFYHVQAYLGHDRNIGNLMHDENVNLMFDSLFAVRDLFEEPFQDICDAYIMGFMGHYTLDCTCHPYVYYKSTHFENLKVSHKYDFGRHTSLETDIDQLMLKHFYGLKPSQYDYAKRINITKEEGQVLSLLLSQALALTFPNASVSSKMCYKAPKSMIFLNKLMRDPSGGKKNLVFSIEKKLLGYPFISAMIPSDTLFAYEDSCNESHDIWYNPWDKETPHNDSIFDLLHKAGEIYKNRLDMYITGINSYEEKTDLLDNLGNNSYCNGLPI